MVTLELCRNTNVVFKEPEKVFENDSFVVWKRTAEVLISPAKYLGDVPESKRGMLRELIERVGKNIRVDDVDTMALNTSIDLFLKQSKTGVHYEMRSRVNWRKDVKFDLFYHFKALTGVRSSGDITFELKRALGKESLVVSSFKTDLFQTGTNFRLCEWWKGMQPSLHLLGIFHKEDVVVEGIVLGLSVQLEIDGDDCWVFE